MFIEKAVEEINRECPVNVYHLLITLILHNQDSYWDQFIRKWAPVAPLTPGLGDRIRQKYQPHEMPYMCQIVPRYYYPPHTVPSGKDTIRGIRVWSVPLEEYTIRSKKKHQPNMAGKGHIYCQNTWSERILYERKSVGAFVRYGPHWSVQYA